MEKVVIVIPTHKDALNFFEMISLLQLDKILETYPKVFAVPESLTMCELKRFKNFTFERFPDFYFSSNDAYNMMCISEEFYQRFTRYEYMLIYQTDAFVFRDRLLEFCDMGYDYIGAPVPWPWHWRRKMGTHVGNGGFSLRKISSVLELIKNKKIIFEKANFEYKVLLEYEDKFFSFCTKIPELNFTAPNTEVALSFSVEYDIYGIYKKIPNWLPFGCHRWYQENFSVWEKAVKSFGYSIPCSEMKKYTFPYEKNIEKRMFSRICKMLNGECINKSKKDVLYNIVKLILNGNAVSVWGYGKEGGRCIQFLEKLGFNVTNIYEKNYYKYKYDRYVIEPNIESMRAEENKIIIATGKEEMKSCQYLIDEKFGRDVEFLLYSDFCSFVGRRYYADMKIGRILSSK